MHGMPKNDLERIDYASLNPGIREVVSLLREHGFDTTDSGDGVTNIAADMEGAIPVPHVHCMVSVDRIVLEALRMMQVLIDNGVEPFPGCVQAMYSPVDGIASVSVFGVDDEMLLAAQSKKPEP
jgi:hypothetical protein